MRFRKLTLNNNYIKNLNSLELKRNFINLQELYLDNNLLSDSLSYLVNILPPTLYILSAQNNKLSDKYDESIQLFHL